jgi:hypothetical protein
LTTITMGAPGRREAAAFRSASAIPLRIRVQSSFARPTGGRPDLVDPAVIEVEELIGMAMLLVVVDQAGIGRGRDDAVVRPAPVELTSVAMENVRFAPALPRSRVLLDPGDRVDRIAAEKVCGPVARGANHSPT